MVHGLEHGADGFRARHLARDLFLPLSQKLRSTCLIILILRHRFRKACQRMGGNARSSGIKRKA